MNVAVIGLGNIGSALAKNLTAGGQKVIVADKTLAKAEKLAGELRGNTQAAPVADAVSRADVVILAIHFNAIKQFITDYRGALAGKIVVDPSNPIAPDGKGGFKKIIPAEQSSGQIIAALLPKGAKVVKAFGTLGAQSLIGRQSFAGTRDAVLRHGRSRSRGGRCKAHRRKRLRTGQRWRRRQIAPDRSGRRSARVRQARQTSVRQRGRVVDLIRPPGAFADYAVAKHQSTQ